ncbi:hypothetical protein P43SY_001862 [Pythium insidiosum]|uniref:Uncharacterized protein n=1 Tax=Pythium insidiosum TaxID=114742 RepID=A0AAD5LI52_PYTIN|nr:hypothetical protein P43SY_001862 [Pythium insidiosum]
MPARKSLAKPVGPLGVWSVEANDLRLAALAPDVLKARVDGLAPSGSFRRDVQSFYQATGLTPHPLVLPFHPDEEDPTTNADVGTQGHPPIVYDLRDIEQLSLRNWRLDDGSLRAIVFALPRCEAIHTLTLFNVQLPSAHLDALCAVIPDTHVAQLAIDWNVSQPIAATDKSEETRVPPPAALTSLLLSARLRVLSLRANGLSAAHADAIAQGLRANTTLESLNLYQNPLGDDGVAAIAYVLPFNTTLKALSLGETQLSGRGARLLVDVLTKYAAPASLLQELQAAEPRIQAEIDLAKKAKKKIDRHTAILNLGLPVLETIDGVQYAPGNRTLLDLVLSGNDAVSPADVLAMSDTLERHRSDASHLRRIKLQRVPHLQSAVHQAPHKLSELFQF